MNIKQIRLQNFDFLVKENLNGSTATAAKFFAKHQSYISRLRKGGKNGWIGDEFAREIENKMNLDAGAMDSKLWEQNTVLSVFDIQASCGGGMLAESACPDLIRDITLTKLAIKDLLGMDNLKNINLCSTCGDSMEPTIPRNSIALVKMDIKEFKNSGVYLFTFQDFIYIKRLHRGRDGVIHVTSDNQKYSGGDFIIKKEEYDQLIVHAQFWKVLPLDFIDV